MSSLHRMIEDAGVELDQRMARALEMCANTDLNDAHVFLALYRLNSIQARFLEIDESRLTDTVTYDHLPRVAATDIELRRYGTENITGEDVFSAAIQHARSTGTLGARGFVRSVLENGLRSGEVFNKRPWTVDLLVANAGKEYRTPLSEVPGVEALVRNLASRDQPAEDFQFILTLEGERLVFRVVSVVDDFVQLSDSGLLVPERAILTHFRDHFGGFTSDEIEELEALINSRSASEADFQAFFERHPHFLRKGDYREVWPHVLLTSSEAGPLIPDFILTNAEAQDAAIVELKTPRPSLIRHQQNRVRFAAAVMEAKAQLLTYKRWFEESDNRQHLKDVVGMEVYEPRLMVIIGRASDFRDEVERATLRADNHEIEIVTYDDILRHARDRAIVIRRGTG